MSVYLSSVSSRHDTTARSPASAPAAICILLCSLVCFHPLQPAVGSQALLRRLEQRLAVRGAATDGAQSLLRQLSPSAPAGRQLDRYPVRVMLCAYMIKEHPEVVFNHVVGGVRGGC